MNQTVLIVLANSWEICRMQSVRIHGRFCCIFFISGSSIYHRQVFLPDSGRITEFNLLTRLQNEIFCRIILITKTQFIYRKLNLSGIVFSQFQVCKCFLAAVSSFIAIGICHLSAVIISGHIGGLIR